MAIKFSFNMTYEQIDAGIVSVGNRSAKVRVDIQKLCVSILARWIETGDVATAAAKAAALVNTADGYYGQALVNWFAKFCSFSWVTSDKSFTYSAKRTTITLAEAQSAAAEPFWLLTPPKNPKPFNGFELLEKLLEKNAKRVTSKAHMDEDVIIPSDLAIKIRAILHEAAQ